MTDKTITPETIKETYTYIMLGETDPERPLLNNKMQQEFLIKRDARLRMTHALIVYNSTGKIPNTISGKELSVVKEFIEAGMQIV
jgi:hypothetical protein